MKLEKVDFEKTGQFSQLFTDYVNQKSTLNQFYKSFPKTDNFKQQIEEKKFSENSRKILCQALENQYSESDVSDIVTTNLSLLQKPNTFTITTGHQLNIFTGPLYFIYKIITVINTCKNLSQQYPEYNFIPIYWMASEDHDFDEISYFRLNGKKYKWQTDQKGAVGKFDPKELKKLAGEIPGMPEIFSEAYSKKTLTEAVRYYTNELFGKHGLIIIDGDDVSLKKEFQSVIEDDIFSNSANELVNEQSERLDANGYKSQVFPREINFFYLKDNIRERIVEEEGSYKVMETNLSFSKDELQAEITNHPERFSPNVILRPLYEEMILPNIAYCGGPGELAYWLQLKSVFEHYNISFPILLPRNFAMIIPAHVARKMDKAGLSLTDLFKDKHQLLKEVAIENSKHDLHLNGQKDELLSLFETIKTKAACIDPTLAPHVEAQQTILKNKLDTIEKKFVRAEKKNQSDKMRQIEDILDKLLPNGSLQERTDNFLNFFMTNPAFIDEIMNYFDPLDFRFNVIVDG